MKKQKRKRRFRKALIGLGTGAGVAVAIGKRKQLGKSLVKGYRTARRKATGGKYSYGNRTTLRSKVTEETVSPRLNNATRRKAFDDLVSKGKMPGNKAINSYIVGQRQSQIGGVAGTKGRTPAEMAIIRKKQKTRNSTVKKRVKRLRSSNQYYSDRLTLVEFKKKKRKRIKNPASRYLRKRRRNRAIANGLSLIQGAAALGSLGVMGYKANKLLKNKKNSTGAGYVPDVSKATKDIRRRVGLG